MDDELKPCPFCGEANQEILMVQHMAGTIIHPTYRVACDNCGGSCGWTDRGDHVAKWNQRADAAALSEAQATIARLEAALTRIVGMDSHIDASIRSGTTDRVVVYGDFARIALAALSPREGDGRWDT